MRVFVTCQTSSSILCSISVELENSVTLFQLTPKTFSLSCENFTVLGSLWVYFPLSDIHIGVACHYSVYFFETRDGIMGKVSLTKITLLPQKAFTKKKHSFLYSKSINIHNIHRSHNLFVNFIKYINTPSFKTTTIHLFV